MTINRFLSQEVYRSFNLTKIEKLNFTQCVVVCRTYSHDERVSLAKSALVVDPS